MKTYVEISCPTREMSSAPRMAEEVASDTAEDLYARPAVSAPAAARPSATCAQSIAESRRRRGHDADRPGERTNHPRAAAPTRPVFYRPRCGCGVDATRLLPSASRPRRRRDPSFTVRVAASTRVTRPVFYRRTDTDDDDDVLGGRRGAFLVDGAVARHACTAGNRRETVGSGAARRTHPTGPDAPRTEARSRPRTSRGPRSSRRGHHPTNRRRR